MKKRAVIAGVLAVLSSSAYAQTSAIPTFNNSVSITTGNTYQSLLAKQGARRGLTIQNNNTNTDNCFIDVTGVVAAGNTTSTNVTVNGASIAATKASIVLTPGQAYTRYYPNIPNGAIVGTCATTGDSLYVETQ